MYQFFRRPLLNLPQFTRGFSPSTPCIGFRTAPISPRVQKYHRGFDYKNTLSSRLIFQNGHDLQLAIKGLEDLASNPITQPIVAATSVIFRFKKGCAFLSGFYDSQDIPDRYLAPGVAIKADCAQAIYTQALALEMARYINRYGRRFHNPLPQCSVDAYILNASLDLNLYQTGELCPQMIVENTNITASQLKSFMHDLATIRDVFASNSICESAYDAEAILLGLLSTCVTLSIDYATLKICMPNLTHLFEQQFLTKCQYIVAQNDWMVFFEDHLGGPHGNPFNHTFVKNLFVHAHPEQTKLIKQIYDMTYDPVSASQTFESLLDAIIVRKNEDIKPFIKALPDVIKQPDPHSVFNLRA